MSQWSEKHGALAIRGVFQRFFFSDSYVIARRRFCSRFKIQRDGSSVNIIRSWVERFRATATAMNNPGRTTGRRTENARDQATNVNSEDYGRMITEFFLPNLGAHP